jgi:single-stranded DNA-binding protein
MTTTVLVSGTLFHAPQSRTKAGGRLVTAALKAKVGNDTQFWQLVAFGETAQAELMRLAEGDALSVQGAFHTKPYKQDAETEFLFGVVAERILPLRQPGKKRRKEGRAATHRGDDSWPPPFIRRSSAVHPTTGYGSNRGHSSADEGIR